MKQCINKASDQNNFWKAIKTVKVQRNEISSEEWKVFYEKIQGDVDDDEINWVENKVEEL